MGIRGNKSNFPRGVIDFGDGEFYGFYSDFERQEENREELRNDIESTEYVIATYGGDTGGVFGTESGSGRQENDLLKQIGWSCGSGELRTI